MEKIADNLEEAGKLPCDTFRVGWEAIDIALTKPLRDSCYEYFRLEDVTPPTMICKDEVNVTFDTKGTRLFANEIENQSSDACGIIKLEIKREGGDWGEYIDFTCIDVHKKIPAVLRMMDKGGNSNTCHFDVVILDNIPPFCEDLADFTGTCDEYHNNELGPTTDLDEDYLMEDTEWKDLAGDLLDYYNNKFGDPKCEDNLACVDYTIQQQYQVIYDKCGIIKARRRYRVTDWNGAGITSDWKYHEISITYKPSWSFTLPVDFFGECGDSIPDPGIIIINGFCDLVGWEHEDKVFDIVPDACYKVVRTYYIINWCKYVQGQEPIEISREENVLGLVTNTKTISYQDVADYGYYTYTQVLKVTDQQAPTITINNVETCIYGVGDAAPFWSRRPNSWSSPF